jgi:hypothetical protein
VPLWLRASISWSIVAFQCGEERAALSEPGSAEGPADRPYRTVPSVRTRGFGLPVRRRVTGRAGGGGGGSGGVTAGLGGGEEPADGEGDGGSEA